MQQKCHYYFMAIFLLSSCKSLESTQTKTPNVPEADSEITSHEPEEHNPFSAGIKVADQGIPKEDEDTPNFNNTDTEDKKETQKTTTPAATHTADKKSKPKKDDKQADEKVPSIAKEGRKTLIISDSMGEGKFGAQLSLLYSQFAGQSCQYSYSSSNMSNWVSGNFSNARDPVVRNSTDGVRIPTPDMTKETADWGLHGLLHEPKKHNCHADGFDRLVVQLGSNPDEDPWKQLRSIVKMANEAGIKDVHFILPPGKKGNHDKFKSYNANFQAELAKVQSENPNIKLDSLNSSDENLVKINDTDFVNVANDHTHFRDNSSTQNSWFDAVKNKFFPDRRLSTNEEDLPPEVFFDAPKTKHANI